MGEDDRGVSQGRQRQAAQAAPFDQVPEGQQHQREEGECNVLGKGGAHVEVEQAVGCVGVDQPGDHPRAAAPPAAHQRVHRASGHERRQRPGQLDCRREASSQ